MYIYIHRCTYRRTDTETRTQTRTHRLTKTDLLAYLIASLKVYI